MKTNEQKIGCTAAILSAVFALTWFITFILKDQFQAVPDWKNLSAYAHSFRMIRLLYVYPSLLLAVSYVILLACLYRLVPPEKKIFALIALSCGLIYSVMAAVNYNIQAVAVRMSLAARELEGIELFLPDNPHSIFAALANSYVYMAISMFFLGFLFKGRKGDGLLRVLLMLQAVTAAGQIGSSMFNLNDTIFLGTSMIWVIGAPAAFFLIAVWIKNSSFSKAR